MRKLLVCGDIHGELRTLVWTLTEKLKYKDADVIVLGDFGVGFGKRQGLENSYFRVKKKLEKSNIKIWAIRGNHDDPDYFKGEFVFPHLELLPDHVPVEINGFSVYPIGGGVSEDRDWRFKVNDKFKHFESSRRIWWEGEKIEKKYIPDLPIKVDIIVSHQAPISFKPICERSEKYSTELWNDILGERNYLEYVLREIRSGYWFYGHYHESFNGEDGETIYRGLGIMEVIEVEKRELV